MGAELQLECGRCSRAFPWPDCIPGRAPGSCLACMDTKNRARTLKRLSERIGNDAAADLARRHGVGADRGAQVVRDAMAEAAAELLAVGLGITDDVKRAAAITGVQYDNARQLNALAKKARAEHPGLVKGETSAIGDTLGRAIAILSIRARVTAHAVPVSQIGNNIKSLSQALENLTGGAKGSYQPLRIIIGGLDSSEDEYENDST